MADTSLDFSVIESLAAEWALPCDCSGVDYMPQPHGEARWVAFARCEACSYPSQKLLCVGCKDFILATSEAVMCRKCDSVHAPFRRLIKRFEPISRK